MAAKSIRGKTLTSGQVAKLIGCAPRTVCTMMGKGLLPGAFRLPGCNDRRFPRESVAKFLRDNGISVPPELETVRILAMVQGAAERWFNDDQARIAADGFELGRLSAAGCPTLAILDTTHGAESCAVIAGRLRAMHRGIRVWGLGWQDTEPQPWADRLWRRTEFDPEEFVAAALAEAMGQDGG